MSKRRLQKIFGNNDLQKCYTELSKEEILGIYQDMKAFVEEKQGIDYLLVYLDENGRKLFFIDQLNKSMIASGDYEPEHNHCTLMFAHEY